ncbi:lytic transglycosylase domain-containing protein [Alicyclobacillus fodiniaquatilis]|uniref:Lytic transglycosylase domain-containing protein n=1 Tax=Alicyclobacillus fodiniaquatilis TaxID=1661150 RepID=A0ABW4JQC9_9BACL
MGIGETGQIGAATPQPYQNTNVTTGTSPTSQLQAENQMFAQLFTEILASMTAEETSFPSIENTTSSTDTAAPFTLSGIPSFYPNLLTAMTPQVTVPTSSSTATASDNSASFAAIVNQAANTYGISPNLLNAVIEQESSFQPDAVSGAGALGLMQLMPSTAQTLGVTNPLDPTQNINGGAKYLSQLLSQFNGNVSLALAAYNAGPGAVTQYGGIPPYAETQNYVSSVLQKAGMATSEA